MSRFVKSHLASFLQSVLLQTPKRRISVSKIRDEEIANRLINVILRVVTCTMLTVQIHLNARSRRDSISLVYEPFLA